MDSSILPTFRCYRRYAWKAGSIAYLKLLCLYVNMHEFRQDINKAGEVKTKTGLGSSAALVSPHTNRHAFSETARGLTKRWSKPLIFKGELTGGCYLPLFWTTTVRRGQTPGSQRSPILSLQGPRSSFFLLSLYFLCLADRVRRCCPGTCCPRDSCRHTALLVT